MADDLTDTANATASLSSSIETLSTRTHDLEISAGSFSRAMSHAFTSSVTGGKQLDDVLKSLALRLSSLTVSSALKPLASGLTSGINSLFSGLFSTSGTAAPAVTAATGAIKPFAAGGVLGTPTYFPLQTGDVGLAGEAGPEAIMPLTRGADGKLGVAASGGAAAAAITINIATPDAGSFRRSESYLTGQIARAVARGQRSQ
jgi:lambda family phage tail tape measure protein